MSRIVLLPTGSKSDLPIDRWAGATIELLSPRLNQAESAMTKINAFNCEISRIASSAKPVQLDGQEYFAANYHITMQDLSKAGAALVCVMADPVNPRVEYWHHVEFQLTG